MGQRAPAILISANLAWLLWANRRARSNASWNSSQDRRARNFSRRAESSSGDLNSAASRRSRKPLSDSNASRLLAGSAGEVSRDVVGGNEKFLPDKDIVGCF